MRSAGNFRPEWGYLAPAPSFARTARIVLVATAIGATAGAGVVLSLIDRSPAQERTSVAARAIVTSVHEAAAPAASQTSATPVTAPAAPPPSPPASSPVTPSDVASQSPNHALVPPGERADQRGAAPSTEANASAQGPAQGPAPITPSENDAPASAHETSATEPIAAQPSAAQPSATETSATQPNSESANATPHSAAGVAALSEPSATGTPTDATDGGVSAQEHEQEHEQEQAAQKKVKHHLANERTPFPGLGTFFRRFFVAHAARPNYSNR
jgi:hypothetical protein